MSKTALIITIICGGGGLTGLLALYTKIVFDYATIKTELQTNTVLLRKIDANQEKNAEKHEELERKVAKKVDNETFKSLLERFTKLETKHCLIHKEE